MLDWLLLVMILQNEMEFKSFQLVKELRANEEEQCNAVCKKTKQKLSSIIIHLIDCVFFLNPPSKKKFGCL